MQYAAARRAACFKYPTAAPLAPLRCIRLYASIASDQTWLKRVLPTAQPKKAFDARNNQALAAIVPSVKETISLQNLRLDGMLMKCTVFDESGNVRSISGVFKKSELCAKHGLQARDLRKIDSAIPNAVPTILVRKQCILVNMLHMRALIKSKEIWLFHTLGADSSLHSSFVYNLQHNLRPTSCNTTPYEHRALETVFASATKALEEDLVNVRSLVLDLLEDLESNIVPSKLRSLLQYTRKLNVFQKRARLVQEAIDELLQQDDDLDGLYLTTPRSMDLGTDHAEVEMLLESYSKQVEEIVNEVDSLASNVAQTKEVIELILDSSRNALLVLDLKVSIGTMGLASGALVAGLFGMNLATQIETHDSAFYLITGGAVMFSALVAVFGLRRLARLRKVGLGSSSMVDRHRAWSQRRLLKESPEEINMRSTRRATFTWLLCLMETVLHGTLCKSDAPMRC